MHQKGKYSKTQDNVSKLKHKFKKVKNVRNVNKLEHKDKKGRYTRIQDQKGI